jgi:hypothetical protein
MELHQAQILLLRTGTDKGVSYHLDRYFTLDMAFAAAVCSLWRAFASAKGADEALQKMEEWKKWLDPTRCDLYFTFVESCFVEHSLLI